MYRIIYLLGDLRDFYFFFFEENVVFIVFLIRVCIFFEILYDLVFCVFVNMIFKKYLILKCLLNLFLFVIVVK